MITDWSKALAETKQPPTDWSAMLAESKPTISKPEDVDPVDSFLIGVGRGLVDVKEGIQQLFKESAVKYARDPNVKGPNSNTRRLPVNMDNVSAAEADLAAFNDKVTEERTAFEESPVGKSLAAKGGRITGGALPSFVVPSSTGGMASRTLTEAATGALMSGASYVPEGQSRGAQAISGSLTGASVPIAGDLAKKGLKKVTDSVRGQMSEGAESVLDAGRAHDVPVLTPDVSNSPTLKKTATLMEDVPLFGLRNSRIQQMGKASSAAERVTHKLKEQMLSRDYGGVQGIKQLENVASAGGKRAKVAKHLLEDIEHAGDDWERIIQTSGNVSLFRTKLIADRLYDDVARAANPMGAVPVKKTQNTINEVLREESSKAIPDAGLIDTLSQIQAWLSEGHNFSLMRGLRSDVGEMISSAYQGKNALTGTSGAATLQRVKDSIDTDLDNFASQSGGKVLNAWKRANNHWKTKVAPFRDRQLAKALKESDPDEVYGRFITRGKGKAERFYSALDEKGRSAVRYGMTLQALTKATDAERQLFSPAKYATELQKIQQASGVFFKGREKAELDGFVNLMRHIERAGQVFENPPTGVRNTPLILAALTGGLASQAPSGAVAGVSGAVVLKQLLTTETGRKLLLKSSQSKPGSKLMNDVYSKAESYISRLAVSASKDTQPEEENSN